MEKAVFTTLSVVLLTIFSACLAQTIKPIVLTFKATKTLPGTKVALTAFDKGFIKGWGNYKNPF